MGNQYATYQLSISFQSVRVAYLLQLVPIKLNKTVHKLIISSNATERLNQKRREKKIVKRNQNSPKKTQKNFNTLFLKIQTAKIRIVCMYVCSYVPQVKKSSVWFKRKSLHTPPICIRLCRHFVSFDMKQNVQKPKTIDLIPSQHAHFIRFSFLFLCVFLFDFLMNCISTICSL